MQKGGGQVHNDSRINARAHFFSVRVTLIWNRLPAPLVQENNLSVFKSMLRTFDFSYTLLGKLWFISRVLCILLFIFWPHISGLLTLCWPFGQYVLCLYFYVIAG